MQTETTDPNHCNFTGTTNNSCAETCCNNAACVLKDIYSINTERGTEQGFYFNLLDRLNICNYCSSFNPDLLLVETHENMYICCNCANLQSEGFIQQLRDYVVQHAIAINTAANISHGLMEKESYETKEEDLFDLLQQEANRWQKLDENTSNKISLEVAEGNGKPKSSNLKQNNILTSISNDNNDIVVDKVMNWDYVSLTYFLSDFSILSRNIKIIEDKVGRSFGYAHIEPINVTFGSYLDRFLDADIVRIPVNDQKVFMAALAYLKKYNIYKISDTPELAGHLSILSTTEDNHITNLIEAIGKSESGVIDYVKLLEYSYLFAQTRAQSYLNKISANISSDVHYYREYKRLNIEAQNRIEYIRVCDIIKAYRNLSNQYLNIEKDLEFYVNYVQNRLNFKLNKDEHVQSTPHTSIKHHKEVSLIKPVTNNDASNNTTTYNGYPSAKFQEKHDVAIESDCSVCFVADTSYFNPIVYCTTCEMGAHIKCIGLSEVPSDNYFCHKCYYIKQHKYCILCGMENYFLQKAKDSSIAYHTFCAFSTKSWIYRVKSTAQMSNKMKSNITNCMYCNSSRGVIDSCLTCGTKHYHPFCGYLNGHYFRVENYDHLNFDDFMEDKYGYSVEMKCDNCSKNYFKEELNCDIEQAELLFMKTRYLRRASIDPKFNRMYLTFNDYLKPKA